MSDSDDDDVTSKKPRKIAVLSSEIVHSNTKSDDDRFAGLKKRGPKIVFSDDEDDNLSPPKTPTSKGTRSLVKMRPTMSLSLISVIFLDPDLPLCFSTLFHITRSDGSFIVLLDKTRSTDGADLKNALVEGSSPKDVLCNIKSIKYLEK